MASHAAQPPTDSAKARRAASTTLSRVWTVVRDGVSDFLDDEPFEKAAAVSYYTLLALAPLLLVVLAIAGMVFGHEAVAGQLVGEVRGLAGDRGAEAIQLVLESASASGASKVSFGFGLITLLIGASGAFVELQAALNKIWDVEAAPNRNALWNFLRHRLVSMAMVFGFGFLLLVSLVVSASLTAIRVHYESFVPWASAWQALNALGSLLVITLWNAMIFKFLPDVRMAWRDVWSGALATAVLFTIGKSAIGAYLGRASIASSYGAAGSLVVLVAWVYYASLVFFVGAEVTKLYAKWRRGRRPRPSEFAVRAER